MDPSVKSQMIRMDNKHDEAIANCIFERCCEIVKDNVLREELITSIKRNKDGYLMSVVYPPSVTRLSTKETHSIMNISNNIQSVYICIDKSSINKSQLILEVFFKEFNENIEVKTVTEEGAKNNNSNNSGLMQKIQALLKRPREGIPEESENKRPRFK